jgi:hypothetical protein
MDSSESSTAGPKNTLDGLRLDRPDDPLLPPSWARDLFVDIVLRRITLAVGTFVHPSSTRQTGPGRAPERPGSEQTKESPPSHMSMSTHESPSGARSHVFARCRTGSGSSGTEFLRTKAVIGGGRARGTHALSKTAMKQLVRLSLRLQLFLMEWVIRPKHLVAVADEAGGP